jgi:chemotaxis protein CheZ
MAEQRKIFRIEKMAAARGEPPSMGNSDSAFCKEVMRELAALRAMLEPISARPVDPSAAQRAQMTWLASRLRDIRSTLTGAAVNRTAASQAPMTRVAHELEAAVTASEEATQKILAAAEEIDQAANNLSAAVKGDSEQGLAQDIRDRVIAIFEACNFQDLTSQRIAKVKTALATAEKSISDTIDELVGNAAPAVGGFPFEGDDGYVSQSEVDSLFAGGVRPPSDAD